MTPVAALWKGVGSDRRRGADREAADQLFAHVDPNPAIVRIHDGEDRHPRAHDLAHLTVSNGDHAVERRPDDGVVQRRVHLRHGGLALGHHAALRLDLFPAGTALEDPHAFLRALVLGLRQREHGLEIVVLLSTDGAALIQARASLGVLAGVLQAAFGGAQGSAPLRDLLVAEAAFELSQSGPSRADLSLCSLKASP